MLRTPLDRLSAARMLLALALLTGCAAAQDAPAPADPPIAPRHGGQPATSAQPSPAQAAPPAEAQAAPQSAAPAAGPEASAAPEAPAAAKTSAAAAEEAARAAAAARAHELGEAVLDRAAHFQRGDVRAPEPVSLHGTFHVGVRDKDGSLIQAEVERWYTRSPERMLTHRRESVTGSASSVGWNGSKAWFRSDADGRVIVYTDDPETFGVDLDDLRMQVRLTRLLLTACVLDALRPQLSDVTSAGTGSCKDLDGAVHATDLVTAHAVDDLFPPPAGAPPPAPGSPLPRLELRFAIDHESGAVRELLVSAPGRADIASQRLVFDYHGPTASGLRVPGNIRVYADGEDHESVRLGVDQPDDLLIFDVNAPIDTALFDPPGG
ncbi:MAG TPA: hypothetical protein VK824_12895 [Planctomycetota bacterium]|nr:hypothetical protein [Planctomycetota bacterium]